MVIRLKGLFLRLDALGLVVFSIIGTNVAMTTGHPALICLVSAVVTGVFGGLLRDLICRRTPLILHKELYASVAFLSSGLYMGLLHIGVSDIYATIATLVIGYSVRMSALKFHWRYPPSSWKLKSLFTKRRRKYPCPCKKPSINSRAFSL